jgi:hypothetical protein
MEGFAQGMGAEGDRIGAAYRTVLDGVDVPLENARPDLAALLAQQKALPATSQSGNGVKALEDLLGTPGYSKQAKAFTKPSVDPNSDDIVTAIRKLGGINPVDRDVAALANETPFNPDPRLGPVWARGDGRGAGVTHALAPDQMAQQLHDLGYLQSRDVGELTDKIADASFGKSHFSTYFTPPNEDPLANAIESLTKQLGQKNAPPAARAGYIRDNPMIPGDVAQNLRSDYTLASATEAKGRDQVLFGQMKAAIDKAIDAALPDSAKGQFSALNQRYGIYASLNAMSPNQQNAFLNQLYRGSDSPDQFYTFLGLAPESKFKEVARGFVTRLKDSATDVGTGNVSAAALGRAINKANPEAMKYFSGPAGPLLQDVGNIGRDVLREQTPNSGTAQRMIYQSMLTGSGLGLGGYLGSQQGGSPGAVIGSALGAFAMPKAAQAAYLSKVLRPLLTAGAHGRKGLLGEEALQMLPYLGRGVGLLGLSQ